MTPRGHRWVAGAGLVVLVALHLDFWRPQRLVLYGGWLPEELAWRLAWMGLTCAYMVYFCTCVWRDEPDDGAPGGARAQVPPPRDPPDAP